MKQEKYKTKVVYRTLNPVWNEQVTFAMPQKHERVSVEVWDKDPFTQEKMGVIRLTQEDLTNLGGANLDEKHWFNLEQAKSGELQMSFQVTLPEISKVKKEIKALFLMIYVSIGEFPCKLSITRIVLSFTN